MTRMHSSRMCTVRSFTVRGSPRQRPWTETHWTDPPPKTLLDRAPHTETPLDREPQGGDASRQRPPLVDGQTPVKNYLCKLRLRAIIIYINNVSTAIGTNFLIALIHHNFFISELSRTTRSIDRYCIRLYIQTSIDLEMLTVRTNWILSRCYCTLWPL